MWLWLLVSSDCTLHHLPRPSAKEIIIITRLSLLKKNKCQESVSTWGESFGQASLSSYFSSMKRLWGFLFFRWWEMMIQDTSCACYKRRTSRLEDEWWIDSPWVDIHPQRETTTLFIFSSGWGCWTSVVLDASPPERIYYTSINSASIDMKNKSIIHRIFSMSIQCLSLFVHFIIMKYVVVFPLFFWREELEQNFLNNNIYREMTDIVVWEICRGENKCSDVRNR